MNIRLGVLAAWAAAFALAQPVLARAAHAALGLPESAEAKAAETIGLTRTRTPARDRNDREPKVSFKTEERTFHFPYGIIINQTNSRDRVRNYKHFPSDAVDEWDRRACHGTARFCARRNENPAYRTRFYPD